MYFIVDRVRWRIIDECPSVVDALVRTQSATASPACPLLLQSQRSVADVEKDVRDVLDNAGAGRPLRQGVESVRRVTVHYVGSAALCVEIVLNAAAELVTVAEAKTAAKAIAEEIKNQVGDVARVDVHLDLHADVSLPDISLTDMSARYNNNNSSIPTGALLGA